MFLVVFHDFFAFNSVWIFFFFLIRFKEHFRLANGGQSDSPAACGPLPCVPSTLCRGGQAGRVPPAATATPRRGSPGSAPVPSRGLQGAGGAGDQTPTARPCGFCPNSSRGAASSLPQPWGRGGQGLREPEEDPGGELRRFGAASGQGAARARPVWGCKRGGSGFADTSGRGFGVTRLRLCPAWGARRRSGSPSPSPDGPAAPGGAAGCEPGPAPLAGLRLPPAGRGQQHQAAGSNFSVPGLEKGTNALGLRDRPAARPAAVLLAPPPAAWRGRPARAARSPQVLCPRLPPTPPTFLQLLVLLFPPTQQLEEAGGDGEEQGKHSEAGSCRCLASPHSPSSPPPLQFSSGRRAHRGGGSGTQGKKGRCLGATAGLCEEAFED